MTEILALSLLGLAFILVLLLIEFLHKKMQIPGEVSRKIIHIAVGLLCVFVPFEFTNHWMILGSTGIFILIIYISKRKNLLTSVHSINRQSIGAYLLPVSIFFTFVMYKAFGYNKIFYLPLIIVTISDPLASFAGMIWKNRLKKNGISRNRKYSKTLIGTLVFFITAFICSYIFLSYPGIYPLEDIILLSFIISIITTFTEAISYRGWDNINIPVAAAAVLVIYVTYFP